MKRFMHLADVIERILLLMLLLALAANVVSAFWLWRSLP